MVIELVAVNLDHLSQISGDKRRWGRQDTDAGPEPRGRRESAGHRVASPEHIALRSMGDDPRRNPGGQCRLKVRLKGGEVAIVQRVSAWSRP